MRFQVTGRDVASNKPVPPFVVEAEDEQEARNLATEQGVAIDAVQPLPQRPEPAPAPPAAPRPASVRQLVLGLAVAVAASVGLTLLLLRLDQPPPEAFKRKAAAIEEKARAFLAERGSELLEFSSQAGEERVVREKQQYPYVGRLTLTYYATQEGAGGAWAAWRARSPPPTGTPRGRGGGNSSGFRSSTPSRGQARSWFPGRSWRRCCASVGVPRPNEALQPTGPPSLGCPRSRSAGWPGG